MGDADSDFILLKIEVTKRHPDEVRRLRKEHKRRKQDVQAHHVIPLSLGGSNAYGNICFLSPEEHSGAHQIIDKQVAGMSPGDRRIIQLPYPVSRIGSEKTVRGELRKDFMAAGYALCHVTINGHEVYSKEGANPVILPPTEPTEYQYESLKKKLIKKGLQND